MSPQPAGTLDVLSPGSRWRAGDEEVEILHVYSANIGTPEVPVVLLVYQTIDGEARLARSDAFLLSHQLVSMTPESVLPTDFV